MEIDPWDGLPVSKIYALIFENLEKKCEEEGVAFDRNKAVKIIATTHADKVKDLIDENMTDYDERKLASIVERCVARYVKLEE